MKRNVYQIVTDRIVGLLESGTVPWHKPWKGGNQWPQNFVSRKAYRGINSFLLNAERFPTPFWLTFKQVQSLGGSIKKGEQSFPVVFWKIFKGEEAGETKRIPFLRYYNVFNVAQCEGIAVPEIPSVESKFQPIETCEQIVAAMPKKPVIHHNGTRACYSPLLDEISMPEANLFESAEGYYSTLFHELTHATGHVSRLNRKEITEHNRFGSDPYSREELVAEMGSAFLSGRCGIENKTIDQSASYIQHWLKRLKEDPRLVVHAAAQAQRACDFIVDITYKEKDETVEYKPKESEEVALRECSAEMPMQLRPTDRMLKIEADGDFWKGRIKPKIRLTGRWLEQAGFMPGSHVHVTCVAPGVIELRSPDALIVDEAKQHSGEHPRYVHDVVTGEFANIGVVLYAPDQRYVDVRFSTSYERLNAIFLKIDHLHLRALVSNMTNRFEELGAEVRDGLLPQGSLAELVRQVLPPDDSSLQWSPPSGGFTDNPAKTLHDLYNRYVERYVNRETVAKQ